MKRILLTAVVCLSLGLAASAQEKAAAKAKPKLNLVKTTPEATAPVASKTVSKTEPKDDLAERTAAKQADFNKNQANAAKAPASAKAALTRD